MVQDAILAAYRWFVGGAILGLRLMPLLLLGAFGSATLLLAACRLDPEALERFRRRFPAFRWSGPALAAVIAVLVGGAHVQARKLVAARRATLDGATASRRNEPSLSGVTQYAPSVAILEEKTYRRTLTLPPDFLTRLGADGVQVLSPYLSDPSADEVLRLRDVFKRSGDDVVFTRDVVRQDETPVTADAAEVAVGFVEKGAWRHYEATFDGAYRFRNSRNAETTMRFGFPLPQGGGTLQEFSIEAEGRFADFSVVATSGSLGVIVGGATTNSTFNYNDSFPAISQANPYTAITNGDLTNVSKLYNQGRNYGNDVFASRDNGVQTGTLFAFDATGAQSRIGTYTVTPVPEPSVLAALGLGALAVLRRRRKA